MQRTIRKVPNKNNSSSKQTSKFYSINVTVAGYNSFDEFADHSTTNRQPYWFTPSLRPGIDYCNLLLTGATKSVTDKLQRVMNAAARIVSGTKKYDRSLTYLLHSELHWFDVADRVTYKLGVTVYKCLHGQAPDYLSELCTVHRSLKLLNDSIFVPPAAIYSLFHGFRYT